MLTDAELAIAAASGDRNALADIYDRYANSLYELCRAVLGDAHEASDALHDTFVIAATRLGGLRDPARLKPWLCAIARHESIRRSSKRARSRPAVDEVLEVPVADQSTRGLVAQDAAALVWDAADALNERERAVLVLNVRQGLEGAELAAAAGLSGATTSVLLSRAKSQLATAVRATLLVRNGRDDCVELAQLVPRRHAALDGLTRKRVARHATKCPICVPMWNKTPEALGVLAAAPVLGAPVALRHKVLHDPQLISFSAPLGGEGWQRDGFPPREPDNSRRRVFAGLAAAIVTIVVALALVFAGTDDKPRLADAPRPHTTTSESDDFAPWPTSPPGENTSTSTTRKTTTTTSKKTTTTRANGAGGVVTTTIPPTTTTTAPPQFRITASGDSDLNCGDSLHVNATTYNGSPKSGVLVLYITDPSGRNTTGTNMDQISANKWSGDTAGLRTSGRWTWWVEDPGFPNGSATSTSHQPVTVGGC